VNDLVAWLHLQSWTNQCKFSHDVATLRQLNYGEVHSSWPALSCAFDCSLRGSLLCARGALRVYEPFLLCVRRLGVLASLRTWRWSVARPATTCGPQVGTC
jgi:hypothetical protein